MTPEQIEDTKIILEFMGFELFKTNDTWMYQEDDHLWYLYNCHYHDDYSDLMPVWHKFRDLKFTQKRHEIGHSTHKDFCSHAITYKPIDDAFVQIAYACKWANLTKQ
jgi:hypothetical protein